jgi:hypothetical protein
MTFFSVAQASKHLGIDAKTLHRWLTDAQLPLQSHPHDGRKKGVSQEHLNVLARLHQRSLILLCEKPSVPAVSPVPELATAVLTLPEQLSILQTQIAALQAQVADLTCLLMQHRSELAISAGPSMSNRTPKLTHPHRTPSAKPKTPAKPVHVIPRVEYDGQGHYVVICPKKGLLPLEPDTLEWFAWVSKQDSFRFVGKGGTFTAHHEWRVPKGAWRAHRQIRNHSYTRRLAPNHELTIAVLEQAAETLQSHLM